MAGEPWLERAASGQLPGWTEATPSRLAHMARVAGVMADWAERAGLGRHDRIRWTACGWLHDALRDAPPEHMRPWVRPPFDTLDPSFWHGPATAERLAEEGARDTDVLDAIRFHTLGQPGLATIGIALMAADFLEPGRPRAREWRADLRKHAPGAIEQVGREIIRAKIEKALDREQTVRPEMILMWNDLTERVKRTAHEPSPRSKSGR